MTTKHRRTPDMTAIATARAALDEHQRRFAGHNLGSGWAGQEFDRLYLEWIRARWDANDAWTRSVWSVRP